MNGACIPGPGDPGRCCVSPSGFAATFGKRTLPHPGLCKVPDLWPEEPILILHPAEFSSDFSNPSPALGDYVGCMDENPFLPEDRIVVLQCQNGDSDALDRLISRWQKRLWQHAYHLTGTSDGAWDVTQESWLGIVRGLPRLADPERFKPWAFRIVTNKANDWIRRQLKQPQTGRDDSLAVADKETTGSSELSNDLYAVLKRLKPKSQMMLSLYYLEQFSVAEVAQVLGIAEGTVKSRLSAARAEFKEHWQDDSNDNRHPDL